MKFKIQNSKLKTGLRSLLVLMIGSSVTLATPVLFTMSSLTGTSGNRSILVVPDTYQNPLWIGTNLVPANPFTLQPVNGQVLTNLAPWGYNIMVSGWPRAVHIVVTNDTAMHNVTDFINPNNFSPLNIYISGVSSGFTGIITNLAPSTVTPNYLCTITGAGSNFVYTVLSNATPTVFSTYVLKGSGVCDGNFNFNGTVWINSTSSPTAQFGAIGAYGSEQWIIQQLNVPYLITTSSNLARLNPPQTPQVWITGNGWTVLPWASSGTTNQPHFNFENFTNGVCFTNIYQ